MPYRTNTSHPNHPHHTVLTRPDGGVVARVSKQDGDGGDPIVKGVEYRGGVDRYSLVVMAVFGTMFGAGFVFLEILG